MPRELIHQKGKDGLWRRERIIGMDLIQGTMPINRGVEAGVSFGLQPLQPSCRPTETTCLSFIKISTWGSSLSTINTDEESTTFFRVSLSPKDFFFL
jgi:hypothetical protein